MPTALIGHTGFVGSNLIRQFAFDECFNSGNISEIRGREFDLLVCAGVSAAKWLANRDPQADRERIDALLADLAAVRARKVIVISTIDVYPVIRDVDESFDCHSRPNHAYGTNRLYFEDTLRATFRDVTVVRIAGVFGPGLRKNIVYDLLHDNCLDAINPDSSFQYYNIANLWLHLQRLAKTGIRLMNFVTEPIPTREITGRFFPGKRVGSAPVPEARYDVRTRHGEALGGPPHYLADAAQVMSELAEFVKACSWPRRTSHGQWSAMRPPSGSSPAMALAAWKWRPRGCGRNGRGLTQAALRGFAGWCRTMASSCPLCRPFCFRGPSCSFSAPMRTGRRCTTISAAVPI